jgi:hypothetical protein
MAQDSDSSDSTHGLNLNDLDLGSVNLDGWYGQAHDIVDRVVSGVSTVATGSLGTVPFFAALPLVGWLAFGWYVLYVEQHVSPITFSPRLP